MTVKELIHVLSHMNPDADVLVSNNDVYYNGLYYANRNEIEPYGDDAVIIGTNYKRKVNSWDD